MRTRLRCAALLSLLDRHWQRASDSERERAKSAHTHKSSAGHVSRRYRVSALVYLIRYRCHRAMSWLSASGEAPFSVRRSKPPHSVEFVRFSRIGRCRRRIKCQATPPIFAHLSASLRFLVCASRVPSRPKTRKQSDRKSFC